LGRRVVLTRGLDTCLFLFSERAWRRIAHKLAELPVGEGSARGMARFMLAGASEVEIDSAGRILVPDYLKEFAQLTSSVVLAGVSDRVEVWDEKSWQRYKKGMEKDANSMAQTLGDLGIL
jgi:MraZ protein